MKNFLSLVIHSLSLFKRLGHRRIKVDAPVIEPPQPVEIKPKDDGTVKEAIEEVYRDRYLEATPRKAEQACRAIRLRMGKKE